MHALKLARCDAQLECRVTRTMSARRIPLGILARKEHKLSSRFASRVLSNCVAFRKRDPNNEYVMPRLFCSITSSEVCSSIFARVLRSDLRLPRRNKRIEKSSSNKRQISRLDNSRSPETTDRSMSPRSTFSRDHDSVRSDRAPERFTRARTRTRRLRPLITVSESLTEKAQSFANALYLAGRVRRAGVNASRAVPKIEIALYLAGLHSRGIRLKGFKSFRFTTENARARARAKTLFLFRLYDA